MFKASNIRYEGSDRNRGVAAGGLGAICLMVRRIGLIGTIDEKLILLKKHLLYHEWDHVLNIAYNILAGGTCLEDLELRRNDEAYLDALGAVSIPDPTTAGEFCRRFSEADVEILMELTSRTRLKVWKKQPESFFEEAILEADGTLAPTTGECKESMDISYGRWGWAMNTPTLLRSREYLLRLTRHRSLREGLAMRSLVVAAILVVAGLCSASTASAGDVVSKADSTLTAMLAQPDTSMTTLPVYIYGQRYESPHILVWRDTKLWCHNVQVYPRIRPAA